MTTIAAALLTLGSATELIAGPNLFGAILLAVGRLDRPIAYPGKGWIAATGDRTYGTCPWHVRLQMTVFLLAPSVADVHRTVRRGS